MNTDINLYNLFLNCEVLPKTATLIILVLFIIATIALLVICIILYRKIRSYKKEMDLINSKKDHHIIKIELAKEISTDYLSVLRNTALLESYLPEEDRKEGLKILRKMYDAVYGKKTYPWEKAYKAISILHNNLPSKLKEKYSELDEAEIQICCLTYMDASNIEIATIMRFKVNTVQAKKSVIRKKLGIDGYGNIRDYMVKELG